MAKASLRLFIIHCSAIPAIALAMYFPGWDVFLTCLYLLIIWQEAKQNRILPPVARNLSGILWQIPGLFLLAVLYWGWDFGADFSYYAIFILDIWQTPILPLINLLPAYICNNRPLYYYLLFMVMPALSAFYISATIPRKQPTDAAEKYNPLA